MGGSVVGNGKFEQLTCPRPCSRGAIRPKILIGPTPAYCPRAISKKNIGKPARKSIETYGILNGTKKKVGYFIKALIKRRFESSLWRKVVFGYILLQLWQICTLHFLYQIQTRLRLMKGYKVIHNHARQFTGGDFAWWINAVIRNVSNYFLKLMRSWDSYCISSSFLIVR